MLSSSCSIVPLSLSATPSPPCNTAVFFLCIESKSALLRTPLWIPGSFAALSVIVSVYFLFAESQLVGIWYYTGGVGKAKKKVAGPLFQIHWWRVVLDESQAIKNAGTLVAHAAHCLQVLPALPRPPGPSALSVCLSSGLPPWPDRLFVCESICLPACTDSLPGRMSVCLSVYLSVCLVLLLIFPTFILPLGATI